MVDKHKYLSTPSSSSKQTPCGSVCWEGGPGGCPPNRTPTEKFKL